ncbi:MAG: helix-turn-helix transcriptional regulator [Spirochaetales bacterium]|nr:helix-turn-helix transcriptional regulator [Spirochaetales bacterium]
MRYKTGIPYFDGHRVLPVYITFFLLAMAHLYTVVAFLTAKESALLSHGERIVLRIFGFASLAIIPVMIVTDYLRWLVPYLWNLYPADRQFVLPRFYIFLNFTIVLALLEEKKFKKENSSVNMAANRWKLSAREWEVAELLSRGFTYRNIGKRLNISLSTVQSHVVQIYQKTDVTSKAGLTRLLLSVKEMFIQK